MSEELRSVLLGTAGLGVAACGALVLAITRARPTSHRARLRAATGAALVTLCVQSAHFAEELVTGFRLRFPEQLGLVPWSRTFFVAFNLFWLVVWALGIRGLSAGSRPALAALWFLGIAALANGVVHPLFSVRIAAYFPGLVTSPVLGIAGFVLLRRLATITRPPDAGPGSLAR